MAAYSMDLRLRVLRDADAGFRPSAATTFDIAATRSLRPHEIRFSALHHAADQRQSIRLPLPHAWPHPCQNGFQSSAVRVHQAVLDGSGNPMNIVLSFSALCILLVVGKILRVEVRLFQKLLSAGIGDRWPARAGARADDQRLSSRRDDGGLESVAGIPHQYRLLGPLLGGLHPSDQTHLEDSRTAAGVWPDRCLGPVRRRPFAWRSCC